jgi:hypothetical protein
MRKSAPDDRVRSTEQDLQGLGVRRVQVTFTEAQWALIGSLRGIMGDSDATVVRNMVMAWLAEKSLLTTVAKERLARWPLESQLQHLNEAPWNKRGQDESGRGGRRTSSDADSDSSR